MRNRRFIKALTPYGNRVLVAIPLSILTAALMYVGMWVLPELAFGYFMLMLLGPAVIFRAITEEN
jgi:hypothetical protein